MCHSGGVQDGFDFRFAGAEQFESRRFGRAVGSSTNCSVSQRESGCAWNSPNRIWYIVHNVLSTELNTIFAIHMPMKLSTMVGFTWLP